MCVVSFVLPAYKARFINQAIDSILSQSYPDFELIIVDDASPEQLGEIVAAYSDTRIRYYRNAENIGGKSLVAQWNHCIQYATGEYIVMAADDDIYLPGFLEQCLQLAKKYPDVDLIRTGVEQINEHNLLIGIDHILPEYCTKHQFLYHWVKGTAFTCIGNYLFKAAVLLSRKFIDFPFGYCADVASTIMMAENGVSNTPEMLFQFRISTIHLSSSKKHLGAKLKATTLLYQWLDCLNYAEPEGQSDLYYYSQVQRDVLYQKCRYDYYNQVIKYLPFSQLYTINDCELLSAKDKFLLLLRFSANKLLKTQPA
jgi:glycosyltransferase involved in cell wall biosynthesis